MNYTRNYQFKKQELTDPSDIRTMGENLDSIDNALSNLNGNVSGSVIKTVTESTASLPTIEANDTIAVASGKINKSLADLDASKLDAENVVNNLTTTSSGYALDARQGKALEDKFTVLRGVIGGTVAKELPAGGSTMTNITTITLPSTASVYLVMAHAQINVASNIGIMQMDLGGRMVRGITRNGGGMVNFATVNGGTSFNIMGFVSSDVENATMTVSWAAYPLY